ncbi:MAG: type II toxin-antitoxin system RelE/ParE family toxin [Alphaproteobacteria bacterium]
MIWREVALNGLENARRCIAQHNPSAAERIFAAILSSLRRLSGMPKIGRPGRVPGTRELAIVGTPYVVAYAVVANRINILAVQHGTQEWPERF